MASPTDTLTASSFRLMAWMEEATARYGRWRLFRRTLAEMQGLSNRELADLGLHRSMLKRVAWMAAYES